MSSGPSFAEEAALDRALARARTPEIPPDLAARIVAQVTRLSQGEPEPAKAVAVAASPPPRWQRAAAFGALAALFAGMVAVGVLSRDGGGQEVSQLAAADPEPSAAPSPALASAAGLDPGSAAPGEATPQAATAKDGKTGIADGAAKEALPANSIERVRPPAPAPQLAEIPTADTHSAEALAQDDPQRSQNVVIDPEGPSQAVYGPPAPQGFGVAGSAGPLSNARSSGLPGTTGPSPGSTPTRIPQQR